MPHVFPLISILILTSKVVYLSMDLSSEAETEDLVPNTFISSSSQLPENPSKTSKLCILLTSPITWLSMLSAELNPTFILGVVLVYGLSQGFAGSFFRVVTDYYWKDVQHLNPSSVQVYSGLYYLPWVMKPIWGVLTDVFPVCGYRRRPYFVFAGVLGTGAAIVVATGGGLRVAVALGCLVGITAAVAVADVTIDACIARNSIERPELAADMQSLCGFVSSVGALVGYSTSGVFVHLLGAQGALGIMAIPPALLIVLGFVIFEPLSNRRRTSTKKTSEKVTEAVKGMVSTIKSPHVWKPSLYMYLSLALSISTHEGQFYWYTDKNAGPAFSQQFVGVIYAIGALASIVGVLIYHKFLKNYSFKSLLFYAQLLYATSGMLDLLFVLRWNLIFHIPDYIFVILEECVSRIVSRIRWMPMIILSTKLCPLGIEGTFFALLMCIDSLGSLSSKLGGGVVLHVFHVTRTDFKNLPVVILLRNLLRFSTLGLIFLVPRENQSESVLPPDMLRSSKEDDEDGVQLATLIKKEEV